MPKNTQMFIQFIMIFIGVWHSAFADEISTSSSESLGILVIGGFINSTSPSKSVSLIKNIKSGEVKAYKTGSVILDYKILSIDPKFMILESQSGSKLKVYRDKFGGDKTSNVALNPSSSFSSSSPHGDTYREDGFERTKDKVVLTNAYRENIKKDLAKILMQASAEPYMVNGQIQGFKLTQIDKESVYSKGGLLDNDIVTAIDNRKLTSVSGAVSLLQSLKDNDYLEIEILRNGSPQKISLSVK